MLAAELGEEVEFIGCRVAVIEIDIDVLAETGAALAEILANQAADRRAVPYCRAEASKKRTPILVVLDLGGGKPPVVLSLAREDWAAGCN